MTCPPEHTAYGSEQLATNAAALHRFAFRYCGGFAPWPCGDHWHVGHPTPAIGRACKSNRTHVAIGRRLAKLRDDGILGESRRHARRRSRG